MYMYFISKALSLNFIVFFSLYYAHVYTRLPTNFSCVIHVYLPSADADLTLMKVRIFSLKSPCPSPKINVISTFIHVEFMGMCYRTPPPHTHTLEICFEHGCIVNTPMNVHFLTTGRPGRLYIYTPCMCVKQWC